MLARWAVLVVMLVGCGRAGKPIIDEVVRLNPPEGVGTARTQIAVARAQVAAKQPAAARARLDQALERVRGESSILDITMLEAVDVLVALGDEAAATALRDEAVAKIGASDVRSVIVRDALAPEIDLESKLARDGLAELALGTDGWSLAIEVGSPVWQAIVPRAQNYFLLSTLADQARRAGKLDAARQLVQRAVPLATTPEQRLFVAEAAALAADSETTKALVATRGTFENPAAGDAQLARIHALLGDAGASEAALKQAIGTNAMKVDDWVNLVLARVKRGDMEGARTFLAERWSEGLVRGVAFGLVEQGQLDLAGELFEHAPDDLRSTVTDVLVFSLLDRGDLAKARALAGEKPSSAVASAYARAGDLAAVRELTKGKDDSGLLTSLAAHRLAQRGKCSEAIAALKNEKYPGETLALVARYCPNARI